VCFLVGIPFTRLEHLLSLSVWYAGDNLAATLGERGCKNEITRKGEKNMESQKAILNALCKEIEIFFTPSLSPVVIYQTKFYVLFGKNA
jgi:hypothetical protein